MYVYLQILSLVYNTLLIGCFFLILFDYVKVGSALASEDLHSRGCKYNLQALLFTLVLCGFSGLCWMMDSILVAVSLA